MSEYKGIKGFQVQTRTEDPVPYAQALADNPYAGVWSAGGSLNSAREAAGGLGIQTAALYVGGFAGPKDLVESYNGTSYTEVAEINTGRGYPAGTFGTTTAGILSGGLSGPSTRVSITESWDGSAWTEVNDLNTARSQGAGFGTSTAGYAVAGGTPSVIANVESWNGSSWTETTDINTARFQLAGNGTTTSGLVYGGNPPLTTKTESWNGSAWTEVSDLNQARQVLAGAGTSNSNGLAFGGNAPPLSPVYRAETESWDGSSWTEVADLGTGRTELAGAGPSNTVALAMGGQNGSATTATEEWAFAGLDPSTTPAAGYADAITGDFYYNSTTGQFKTVNDGGAPLGSFASGANLPSARDFSGGIGVKDAALCVGGTDGTYSVVDKTIEYNGTAWTETGDLNLGRSDGCIAADGTTESGIIAGGQLFPSPGGILDQTETFNGSSWSEVSELNTARDNLTSSKSGSSTASLAFMGGAPSPYTGRTEEWNGSNWTEKSDLNNARERGSGGGSSTAAIAVDGARAPAPANPDGVKYFETWDGSSWTSGPDTNTAHYYGASWGTTTDAVVAGTNPANNVVEGFNGTAWSEISEMGTNRVLHGAGSGGPGSQTGIIFAGSIPPYSNATEEWTADAFQIKTVTTS